jgi:hypothetical protein
VAGTGTKVIVEEPLGQRVAKVIVEELLGQRVATGKHGIVHHLQVAKLVNVQTVIKTEGVLGEMEGGGEMEGRGEMGEEVHLHYHYMNMHATATNTLFLQ